MERRRDQRAALHRRAAGRGRGPQRARALLAANAGSGKTAVMVERFVEAVLLDGVPGRLDPGADVHREGGRRAARARAAAASRPRRGRARARPSTPPGSARSTASARACCARGRSPPAWTRASRCSRRPPPGGSPRAAYERALEAWAARARRAPAVDLAAAYGAEPARHRARRARRRCAAAAPSRGCRSRPSGPRLEPRRWPPRARSPRRELAGAGDGIRVSEGAQRARGVRAGARRRRGVPSPGELDAGEARRGREGARDRAVRGLPRRPGRPTAAPAPTTTRAPR